MFFFFQAEDGIRDGHVTGVQTCAMPSGSQIADIAGMAVIGSAASAASAKIMTCSSEEAISSRSGRFTGGRGLPSYMALATSGELATSVMNCWANPALAAFEAT